jgi:hypothetical protein
MASGSHLSPSEISPQSVSDMLQLAVSDMLQLAVSDMLQLAVSDMLQLVVSCTEDLCAGVRYASACRFVHGRPLRRCPISFSLPFPPTKTSARISDKLKHIGHLSDIQNK